MVLVLMDPKGAFLLITSILRLPIYSVCSPINYCSFCVQVFNIHTITPDCYHVASISHKQLSSTPTIFKDLRLCDNAYTV